MWNPYFAALALIFLGNAAAFADAEYKACIDATGKNDEWARCGGQLIDRNDARMAGYLKRLREVTDGDTLKAIEAEQEAWDRFREVACEFYGDPYAFGREGQVLSLPWCKAEVIRKRGEELREYIRQIDP